MIDMKIYKKYNSYQLDSLQYDVLSMSYLFEYCLEYFKIYYGIRADRNKFVDSFLRSSCRAEMELGHPKLINQSSLETFRDYIDVDLDGKFFNFKAEKYKRNLNVKDMYYWIGGLYALMHYLFDVKTKDLLLVYTLETAKRDYYMGHEVGYGGYISRIREPLMKDLDKFGIKHSKAKELDD